MARQFEVSLDGDLCIGSGLCLGIAPQYFEVGPGQRTVLRAAPTPADPALLDAAACCPVEAIKVVEAAS